MFVTCLTWYIFTRWAPRSGQYISRFTKNSSTPDCRFGGVEMNSGEGGDPGLLNCSDPGGGAGGGAGQQVFCHHLGLHR